VANSNIVLAGAISFWLLNTLASVVRGTSNMLLPAAVVIGGGALTLCLSPALIFGWGPLPPLGIAGAGVARLSYYSLGSVVLRAYLLSGRSLVRLTLFEMRWQQARFWEILRVGLPGSLNTVFTSLNVVLLTSLVGPFGTFALAGYGIGARLVRLSPLEG
jgi:Na+-driven multidrug efflux pump